MQRKQLSNQDIGYFKLFIDILLDESENDKINEENKSKINKLRNLANKPEDESDNNGK